MRLDIQCLRYLLVSFALYHRHGKHLSIACGQLVNSCLQLFLCERGLVCLAGHIKAFDMRNRDSLVFGRMLHLSHCQPCRDGRQPTAELLRVVELV